jgi:H+-translocating NAD(P) transhydrogenase subunit beta
MPRHRGVLVGFGVGALIGWPLGTRVAMTAMRQRIAISHLFGALAATLVGIAEYYSHGHAGEPISRGVISALAFEMLFGALTL